MTMSDLQTKLAAAQEENASLKAQLKEALAEKIDTTSAASIETVPRLALKPRRVLKGHLSKVSAIHWSKDSKRLVSVSQDGKLIVWNAFTMHKQHMLAPIWPVTPKCELVGHEGYVSCVRFVENKTLVTSSGDRTCKYWDVDTKSLVKTFTGHEHDVMSVDASSQNLNLFASGGCDGMVKLWDIRSGSCVQTLKGHKADVNSVRFFPTGQCIGSGSDDATCRLFDIRAERELMQYESDKITCGVNSIDFSISGRFLFAAYEELNCVVWDVVKGKSLALLTGHDARVTSIGVTADGMALATASWDATIKVWA